MSADPGTLKTYAPTSGLVGLNGLPLVPTDMEPGDIPITHHEASILQGVPQERRVAELELMRHRAEARRAREDMLRSRKGMSKAARRRANPNHKLGAR